MYTLEFRKSNGVVEENANNYVDLQHDGVQYFSLGQLVKATDNFKVENKIGQGGFGIVYLVNMFMFLRTKVLYHYPHFLVQILLGARTISSHICDDCLPLNCFDSYNHSMKRTHHSCIRICEHSYHSSMKNTVKVC